MNGHIPVMFFVTNWVMSTCISSVPQNLFFTTEIGSSVRNYVSNIIFCFQMIIFKNYTRGYLRVYRFQTQVYFAIVFSSCGWQFIVFRDGVNTNLSWGQNLTFWGLGVKIVYFFRLEVIILCFSGWGIPANILFICDKLFVLYHIL